MASLQDLTRRITSVGNTRKITRAMEMVAAARLRKAQERIETLRPFAAALLDLTARVAGGSGASAASHPLLAERDVDHVCIVMFSGDRGLAGALNANVLRRSLDLYKELKSDTVNVSFIAVGRKGASALKFRNLPVDDSFVGITDAPKYRDAEGIAQQIIDHYTDRSYDRVILVYNHFDSAITQTVIDETVLPLQDADLNEAVSSSATSSEGVSADWEFEPSEEALLNRLLPTYIEQACYRALLESTASEFGARMTAMRNATENAGDILDQLTLQRNRARQAAITQEILEIVAGADAL